MRKVLPDYNRCLVNLSQSILKHFGVETSANTLPEVDAMLDKGYSNVVVLLLDGMGVETMERILDKEGPFRRNLKLSYSSVFPPTTVAATTSLLSGKMPSSHGWLGWDNYYPELDRNVTVFLNRIQGTDIPAAPYHVADTFTPYKNILELIEEKGGKAYGASPFLPPNPKSLEEILDRIRTLCSTREKKFIYGYWGEPDATLHQEGGGSENVRETMRDIERKVYETVSSLEDTLFLITADHGHLDNRTAILQDYEDIMSLLLRLPSIEPRSLNFFVKEGKKEEFKAAFLSHFSEDFDLYTKEEVIEMKLFGEGEEHPRFRDMLGDFLAVARSDLSIYYTKNIWASMHAGYTESEMIIPLISFERN